MSFKNIERRENCCRISTVQRGHVKQARISCSSPFKNNINRTVKISQNSIYAT
jgi:hypothetical protein